MDQRENLDIQARYDQAMADADIEGLPRIPKLEAMVADWDKLELSDEDRIARLKEYFRANTPPIK